MKCVSAATHTWIAARVFLLDRCDDFYLQLTRTRKAFNLEAIHDLDVICGLIVELNSDEKERQTITEIIKHRRRTLFADYLRLHASNPLDRLCAQVQGLL